MKRLVSLLLVLLALASSLSAASIAIPTFYLLTRGALSGASFPLETQADVTIQFGGGYKFGGQLSLSLSDGYLEDDPTLGPTYDAGTVQSALNRALRFESASVIVRDLLGIPIDLTYFVGETERLANGDIFAGEFGTDIIASDVRGLLHFPTGVSYDGIHAINGTGITVASSGIAPWLRLGGSIYQDGYLGTGFFSTDLRAAINFPSFKAETFLGGTFPAGAFGIYRGGLLLYYSAGTNLEFLAEIGIPRYAPVTDGALGMNDFFFLFEPRVHIGFMSAIVTMFWHPEYYEQAATSEAGDIDIVVKLVAGNVQKNIVSGGIESAIQWLADTPTEQLRVDVGPIVSINAGGVLWDFKVNVKAVPFSLTDFLEAYIGIRTEF